MAGLVSASGQFINGTLYCEYTRTPILDSPADELNAIFDLEKDAYYILLARASEVSLGENGTIVENLGKHLPDDKQASPSSVHLNETAVVGEDV
jgi:hypothetical protein